MNFANVHVNNVIRQVLFILGLILVGALIFRELNFLLGGAMGAVTFYTILRHPYSRLVETYHWKKSPAALLVILLLVIFLLLFGFAAYEMVVSRVSDFDGNALKEGLRMVSRKIYDLTGLKLQSSKILDQAKNAFLGHATGVLNSAAGFVANLALMIFILYFMFVNYIYMEKTALRLMPFKGKTLELLTREFKSMIVSNAIGIPAIMIVQGTTAAIGYWIFGVKDPMFWGVITGFFSIIPFIGTISIWGTLSVFLLTSGQIWQGVGLLAYCGVIVSSMDNVVRIILGRFMANTHPLVTILGVVMGLNLFGFWGIVFGPLMIEMFLFFFKIYRMEYLHENEEFPARQTQAT